jgi:hypothetical protein
VSALKLIRRERIGIKVGKRVMVEESALEEFIERGRMQKD